MRYSIVYTDDGTPSCLDSLTGELCHNRAGAYTEALKHYVEPSGLLQKARETGRLRLLDACFGLGYNTWVLLNELVKESPPGVAISVIGIESSPEILSHMPLVLNSGMFDALKSKTDLLEHNIYYRTQRCTCDAMDRAGKEGGISINVADGGSIELEIRVSDLRAAIQELQPGFDAIFHDPFSPAKMPELWTVDLFCRYAQLLSRPHGRLLTYSTAAAVRGGLQQAGFQVFKTPALGGKQGGTVAGFLDALGLALDPYETAYIASRAGIPYRDSGLSFTAEEIRRNRELAQRQSDRPPGNTVRKTRTRPAKPTT